jgi:hypothetical protein
MMRQRFLKDIKVVEDGGDPKGILRDQSRNHALSLRPAGHDFSYPAVEPSFAPGRDAKLVRSQAEARQQQLLAAIAGNGAGERRRRGTAAFLFFGQPDWIADEYERIYDERLAKLPAEKRASVPRLPAAAD